MKNRENEFLYSTHVLDLVRLAATYCQQIEDGEHLNDRQAFIDVMRGLLPMLYLKMTLLGSIPETDGWIEPYVTEEDYNMVRTRIAKCLNNCDDYLDVFVEDFKYSDTPVLRTISEDLADIYQVLRDLTSAYQTENEEIMTVALYETNESFATQWGQTILNALRALHDVRFNGATENL